MIGDQICLSVTISPTTPDVNTNNNTLNECWTVGNSLDPNIKEVSPLRISPNQSQWLNYSIHFQNTGSDTAYHVILRDTLDSNLMPETFQYIASSHYAVIQLLGNKMTFTFPHINLVDSATNPALSTVWIQYKVKTKSNIPLNSTIRNKAYIYFDSNPAVMTNTAITTVTCSDTLTELSAHICAGDFLYFYGRSLSVPGIYTDTLHRTWGCDSIIRLNLTVQTVHSDSIYSLICEGDSFVFKGIGYSTAGIYSDTIRTAQGCDSLWQVIILSTYPINRDTMTLRVNCDHYFYKGQDLTTSGIYTDTGQSIYGCDSISILQLALSTSSVSLSWDSLIQTGVISAIDSSLAQWCDSVQDILIPLRGGSPSPGYYSGIGVINDTLHTVIAFADPARISDTIYYTSLDTITCSGTTMNILVRTACTVGLTETTPSKGVSLYPNPNNGHFVIATDGQYDDYVIYDIIGRGVAQDRITRDRQSMDISNAPAGVYTIHTKSPHYTSSIRFTVVK